MRVDGLDADGASKECAMVMIVSCINDEERVTSCVRSEITYLKSLWRSPRAESIIRSRPETSCGHENWKVK